MDTTDQRDVNRDELFTANTLRRSSLSSVQIVCLQNKQRFNN